MIENGHPEFEPPTEQRSQGRETFLAIMLMIIIGGPFVLLLYFATFGFLGFVVLIALALAVFGVLNYYLWGRRLSRDIEAERAQLERDERETPDWRTARKPPWQRRF